MITFFVVIFLNAFVGHGYDPDQKYKLGWIPTGIMGFYICVWLTIIFGSSICNLINAIKVKFFEYRDKCYKKEVGAGVEDYPVLVELGMRI